jgi:ankyrin repeat protein
MITRSLVYLSAFGLVLLLLIGCVKRRPEDQLIEAAGSGNIEEIQRLLAHGANVNCTSRTLDKSTPLIWAVTQRRETAVVALLAAGADPNVHDAHNKAALFYAFSNQMDLSPIITALIKAGADGREYKSLYEGLLPPDSPNRIAFEKASLLSRGNPALQQPTPRQGHKQERTAENE